MNACRALISGLTAILFAAGSALTAPGASGHSHAHGHSHRTFAAGAPGDAKKPARTIEVIMKETDDGKMLYEPSRIEVKRGEQVHFALRNVGKVEHEFILDSVENNAKHKIAMQKHPEMEHDDPNGRRLAPGQRADIVWRFTKRGTFEFACLIPGHYESGMRGALVVK